MGNGICLVGYPIDKLYEVKGWDGFVSPEGLFYKVTTRDEIGAYHDDFVELFTDVVLHTDIMKKYEEIKLIRPEYQKHLLSYKDAFINIMGYINFEHVRGNKVDIGCPKYRMNNKKITREQINAIKKLLEINGDDPDNIFQIFEEHDNLHDVDIHRNRYM